MSKFRPYVASIIVNMTSLSVGMAVGWMSPAATILQSKSPSLGNNRPLTDNIINWMGSLLFLGSVAGVFVWGILTDRFGRKPAGYLIALPLVIGWIMILTGSNHVWLLAGRFITGLSVTGAAIIPPLYVNEISEDYYRGTTGSFVILFFNFGILLAYFVGTILSLPNSSLFCFSIPVIYLFLFYFLPESPVYLYSKGKQKETLNSLLWFRDNNNVVVEKELTMYKEVFNLNERDSRVPFRKLIENSGNSKAMIISLVLFSAQHYCGRPLLIMYTTVILQKSKMDFSHEIGTVIVGFIQLFSCLLTSYLIDRINRKLLITISFIGMSVSLFIIGFYFYLAKNLETNILHSSIPFIFICFHTIFYFMSASMPYVLSAEILQPEIRPLAFSITIFWAALVSFTCIKIYGVFVDIVDIHGTFWFFATLCSFTVIFTITYIPETRGKSPVEIFNKLNKYKESIEENKNSECTVLNGCELIKGV